MSRNPSMPATQMRTRLAGEPTTDDRCGLYLGNGECCDNRNAEYATTCGFHLVQEIRRLRSKLERANDSLAEADQVQTRTDEQIGDTRDGVMAAIEEAGLAPHVCDDDDLPDMVRHALMAAKKLAQPALWTYSDKDGAA